MQPEDPSEDLRLQFISAVPQCWADRGHYSYLDSPRPEDALLFFLPEESGCSFTLYLDNEKDYAYENGVYSLIDLE